MAPPCKECGDPVRHICERDAIAKKQPQTRIEFTLPDQRAALEGTVVTRLAMTTGILNLLWVVVTVLMIVRPGSTTGV